MSSVNVQAQLFLKACDIEAQLLCVPREIGMSQRTLVGDQLVVHRPERALRTGGFRCLGRRLSVRVLFGLWQMAPDEAEVIAESLQQRAYPGFRSTAELTFEVAVFNECDRCVLRTSDVVAPHIDPNGEIAGLFGAGIHQDPDSAEALRDCKRLRRWPISPRDQRSTSQRRTGA
jgi:hypothetical protein